MIAGHAIDFLTTAVEDLDRGPHEWPVTDSTADLHRGIFDDGRHATTTSGKEYGNQCADQQAGIAGLEYPVYRNVHD